MQDKASILKLAEQESRELLPGARAHFVHSEHLTVGHWTFEADVPLPEHAHPHEQVTNIIDGVFELTIEGETKRLESGMVVVIPPNVAHSGHSITECRIIDVWYPAREDYR